MDLTNYDKWLDGAKTILIKFAEALVAAHNWYERNAEKIAKYLLVFADFAVWCSATDKLTKNQIVFTDDLSIEFAEKICKSENVQELVEEYYFDNDEQNMRMLMDRCEAYKETAPYKELYIQTLDAYQRAQYHLACIGMFSLLDGVLADVSHMITATNFKSRIQAIESKISNKIELNEIDRKTLCIYTSIEQMKDSVFGDSRFTDVEPEGINRHWVIHGRTRKVYLKYDFLKVLLCLDAICYMSHLADTIN